MKILLLGGSGFVGSALKKVAVLEGLTLHAPSHAECDIRDGGALERVFESYHPTVVINATGYTAVDQAEDEREKAFELNAEVVGRLASLAERHGAATVQLSTDYIFDGAQEDGYEEDALPTPLNVYGESKVMGEKLLMQATKRFFIVRTAWPFGHDGRNFVNTMLNCAAEGKPLSVVTDQRGSPTFTQDLAESLLALIKSENYGIYHRVNSGSCSWYELACEIFLQLGIPYEIKPITSEQLGRKAQRPPVSILKTTKLPPLRHWREALEEYLQTQPLIL